MPWQVSVIPLLIAGNTTVINSQGMFVYNGPPATGNLLLSIANANGTDQEGNPFDAILSIYGAGGATAGPVLQFFLNGTQTIQKFITNALSENITATLSAQVNNSGAANESMSFLVSGPASTIDARNTLLVQQSAAHDSSTIANAQLQLIVGGSTILATLARWDANGQTMTLPILMTPPGSNPAVSSGLAVVTGLAGSGGSLGVVDGGDGVTYATERKTYYPASTPLAASPGTNVISHPALSGRNYAIHAQLYVTVSGAAQQLFVGIGVTGGSGHVGVTTVRAAAFVNASDFPANVLTAVTAAAALAVGNTYIVTVDASVTIATTGVINFTMAGTNANDLTVGAGSYITIDPG